jgi:(R,R)-butanediol dehydrogenase/meso-butanediol dehydrogenase/diacetyl reductase
VATHAVRQAEVRPGQTAAVLGLGPIGLHTAQVLLAKGVSPVLGVDLSPLRRAVASELGVTVIDDAGDLPAAAGAVLGEREVDVVFEASGAPPLVPRAVELVRPRGLVVIVALYEQPVEIDLTRMVSKEVSVRTSAHSGTEDFRDAIDLLATGQAKAHPLITQRRPLHRLGEAFETMLDKDQAVKVLVIPDA